MKKIIFLLVIFSSLQMSVEAQPGKQDTTAPVMLNHIAMYVYNLQTSTSFYEKILKFKQVPEPFKDGKHTWFDIGSHSKLHLIQGAEQNIKRDKNDHLCFSVLSTEAFVERLKLNRVTYFSWLGEKGGITVRVDGVKQVYFQDPDGHWIEINDDRSGN